MPEQSPRAANLRLGGCILAGGKATRMGGIDKGLLKIAGISLTQRILLQLLPQVEVALINASRNLEQYRQFGVDVIEDRLTGHLGPLAGMHAALLALGDRVEQVLFIPCDAPDIAPDLGARLSAARNAVDSIGASYARARGISHPTFCVVATALHEELEHFLTDGGRRLEVFLQSVGAVAVDFDDEVEHFANLNSQQDLARYLSQHSL